MAITREQLKHYQGIAKEYLSKAGIVLTPEEEANIEIADLGLGEFETTGLALVTYINTERCCAKDLVLMPGQTCPRTISRFLRLLEQSQHLLGREPAGVLKENGHWLIVDRKALIGSAQRYPLAGFQKSFYRWW